MEKDMIKRYTFAVTQELPDNQQADIEKELNGLIEDMLEDRLQGREATKKDIEEVLLELGDPKALADKYRGGKRYLIGPETFPFYVFVLKIVLFATGIAMFVVFAIQSILNPQQILDYFVRFWVNELMAFVQAFAWVTGVFAVIELTVGKKADFQKEMAKEWSPADLPEIPDENTQISRAEPIFSIVFVILFLVLVSFSIDKLGMWIRQNNGVMIVIPFFNEAVFRSFLPFIWGISGLTIIQEIIKLVTRKQTLFLMAFEAAIHVLSFVLAWFMLSSPAIWNAGFVQQLVEAGMLTAGSESFRTVTTAWAQVTSGLIYLIGVITVFELASLAIKALRFKSRTWRNRLSRVTID